jgi:hypothetical protein
MVTEQKTMLAKMRGYEQRCTEIEELLGNNDRLIGAEQQKARSLLKSLKDDLKEDCRVLRLVRRKSTKLENAFLTPALTKAHAHLSVSVGSVPGPHWRSELYVAKSDISRLRVQLEKAK